MYLACVLARALKFGGVHGYVYFLFFKQKVHISFILTLNLCCVTGHVLLVKTTPAILSLFWREGERGSVAP